MKISVFYPKNEFPVQLQNKLNQLGEISYAKNWDELSVQELIRIAAGTEIICIDPDVNFGGFEKAKEKVTAVAETLPNLKGLALDTTSYGWIDLDYFRKRNIPVSNVPHFSRESVAEHTLGMLLGLAKRLFVTDRKTQKGQYKLEMGFELKGKTLGIIGLGNIGSRMAELGLGIGMKVIAYNRSSKTQNRVEMASLEKVIKKSDALSLHVIDSEETKKLINEHTLELMKDGIIIVNTVDRSLVDEEAMAKAVKSGKVYGYAFEAEDLEHGPLANLENAVGFKGFGWYTKEALENLFEIWTDNIIALSKGTPKNRVA